MSKTIKTLFEEKIAYEKLFKEQVVEKWNELKKLIPKELEKFINESIWDPYKWITELYTNTSMGSNNSNKIKNPEDYGFHDTEDCYRAMLTLKEAWKNTIRVQISNEEDYISVRYYLI